MNYAFFNPVNDNEIYVRQRLKKYGTIDASYSKIKQQHPG